MTPWSRQVVTDAATEATWVPLRSMRYCSTLGPDVDGLHRSSTEVAVTAWLDGAPGADGTQLRHSSHPATPRTTTRPAASATNHHLRR